jgi:photosystem II stability/assembly factor-like uncharacterized protein
MKHFGTLILVTILSGCSLWVKAQPWMNSIQSETPTFFEIQDAFYDYWKDKPIEKGQGYKPFKRWEWYWEPRINADGSFPKSSATWDAWHDYLKTHPQSANKSALPASWSFVGPSTTPGGYNGLGRTNCIAFHPTNANTFWVGTPAGGLWKTTNGGSTWSTNTDNLPVLGVSDIAIDYTNPSIMYIATGDGDFGSLSALNGSSWGDTKSIGILKSTDGGNTWNPTGMNWDVMSSKLIRRLVMNPVYPQELLAATSDGIYQTLNGGASWNQVQAGHFIDLEFKPNNPDTAYAATYSPSGNAQIFRTTNYGQSWTSVASLSGVQRINLAVSPNWPALVDALCSNTSGGLAGLWFSGNSGASFSQYFTGTSSNNLLHNSYNASGSGGQGHYDLAYAVNPSNSSDIWLGGINTWNSTDDGSNWSIKTMWNNHPSINPNGVPTVHADKHFIAFHPLQPSTMFECNDGGLYKTNNGGTSWVDLSNGLEISQIYRIGVSQTISNNIICGLQDNGSREIYNNQWYEQTGGDGMECIIDYSNPNIEYATYAYGKMYRTYDFWANQTTISDNIPGQPTGAWVTPFIIDPVNPAILYAGYDRVYKTTNRGDSWSSASSILTNDKLRSLAVAPSNTQTIYAADFNDLYRTTNGGGTWNQIGSTDDPNARITYLAVNPNNSQQMYITKSGYVAGNKVWMTPDGGSNWYNYSGSLPNVPVNCIVYQNGTNEGLYVGTDVGVFYTDGSMADWIPYQNGLPNVVVTELEISYNDNKLWAATFGRGLWKSDVYSTVVSSPESDSEASTKISVYPNPNDGLFTVELPPCRSWDIHVYNAAGQVVWSNVGSGSSKVNIDIATVSRGIYLIQVVLDGKLTSKKVLVDN